VQVQQYMLERLVRNHRELPRVRASSSFAEMNCGSERQQNCEISKIRGRVEDVERQVKAGKGRERQGKAGKERNSGKG
jgi:hypothetical protein